MSRGIFSDLAGKTALVTGASSGLGAYFAALLAEHGVHVIAAARREEPLLASARRIAEAGGRCETLKLDVADADSIAAAAPALARTDILVNNAGIASEGAALDQSEADWDRVVDTNLKGMFLLATATARAMRARDAAGTIVNICSILGIRQANHVLPYAVSKAGAIQLTKTLALELARYRIRVNALAPGYFATEINREFRESEAGKALVKRVPQRRLGDFGDLAGPLLLLASDAGAYMTGSVLVVDGGHLVSGL